MDQRKQTPNTRTSNTCIDIYTNLQEYDKVLASEDYMKKINISIKDEKATFILPTNINY